MSETAFADAPKMKPRPTSPHLQIYRPQITSVLSILHRFTEIALAFGVVFLTWGLLSVVFGPSAYGAFIDFTQTLLGRVMVAGWSWCLFYHLLYDVRQLFLDMGKGFEIQTVTQTGMMVVLGSFILTALVWLLAMSLPSQITGVLHG